MIVQVPSSTRRAEDVASTDAESQTDPIEKRDLPVQTPFDSDTYDRAGAKLKEQYPKLLTPGDYVTDGKVKVMETEGRWPLSRDCGVACQLDEDDKVDIRLAAANQSSIQALSPGKDSLGDLSPEESVQVGSFLKNVSKTMEAALQNNSVSQAFLGLEMSWTDQSDSEAVVRHSLEAPLDTRQLSAKEGDNVNPQACLDVTGVSWNSRGNVIAISYGDLNQTGWCNLKSCIAVWHLHKLEEAADTDGDGVLSREEIEAGLKKTSQPPSTVLEMTTATTFVSTIEFHPQEPAILASGTYSGEVMVWDVSAESEPLLHTSRNSDYSHREPITCLRWVKDRKEKAMQVASISTDGRLLLWSLANKLDSPIIGFHLAMINPQRLRQEYKASGAVTSIPSAKEKLLGGCSFSFFPENRGEVIVGTESGAVLKCAFPTHDDDATERPPDLPEAQGVVKWTHRAQALVDNVPGEAKSKLRRRLEQDAMDQSKDKITLQFIFYTSKPSPEIIFPCGVNFNYEGCMGPVHSTMYSPFHRHLFATGSTDGSLRLYHKLRRKCLLHIEPPCGSYLYSVVWSPVRPMVIAAVAGSGALYIYDLKASTARPVVTEQVAREGEAISMSWNKSVPSLICVGTANGCAKILEISESLRTPVPLEQDKLNEFAAAALEVPA